jgi:hypothetical protein
MDDLLAIASNQGGEDAAGNDDEGEEEEVQEEDVEADDVDLVGPSAAMSLFAGPPRKQQQASHPSSSSAPAKALASKRAASKSPQRAPSIRSSPRSASRPFSQHGAKSPKAGSASGASAPRRRGRPSKCTIVDAGANEEAFKEECEKAFDLIETDIDKFNAVAGGATFDLSKSDDMKAFKKQNVDAAKVFTLADKRLGQLRDSLRSAPKAYDLEETRKDVEDKAHVVALMLTLAKVTAAGDAPVFLMELMICIALRLWVPLGNSRFYY